MRTNTTLKTKAMSILLAIVMLLGMMPMSAFAADESTVITITNDNMNDASDAYLVDDFTLLLGGGTGMGDTYSFMLGPNPDGSAFTFLGVNIGGFSTVRGGKAVFKNITNAGTISGGSFDPESGELYVENRDTGAISGGTFNGNQEGRLFVENKGSISGGTFYGEVANTNYGTISNGTFNGLVTNYGTITGGTFNGVVINTGTISSGTFSKGILNMGGTIADGVNATVAQGGDLAITMQTLGTGSITVKQNAIDIPSGKAGETYNVAASGGTLVGLYMLTEGETVPAENYAIESDFRAVLDGLGGYDFTMPNEAVTIVAVFDDYEPEITEVNFFTNIIRGTDAASLAAAEWYGGTYPIDSLYSFTEDTVLPGDVVPATITHENERYDFAGFIMSTDTESFYLVETLTIPAEPAYGTTAWEEWKASVPEGLNAAYILHTHSYSTATCSTPATCSCGATTGGVDSTNHTGRTEVRDKKDATEFEEGYTGDTYCLGCNTMIKQGEVIGATHTHSYTKEAYHSAGHYTECDCGEKTEVQAHSYTGMFDSICDCGYNRGLFVTNDDGKDFFEVGFIPGDSVTLPDDAELVVEDHYPSLAPIASTIVPTAETEYVDIPENNISRLEDKADSYMTGGYMIGEIIVIDGEKYMVCVGADEFGYLIRLSDKAKFIYTVQESTLAPSSMSYDVEIQTNRTIVINGAKYDVPATIAHNGIEQYAVLYVDGVLAGLYSPSANEAAFVEGYDPETLKAQQDDNDLGSVTIPADYNNAAIADFAPGKTYKVSVIGSNDISVEGLTDVNGTVTQTFTIPDALVGAKNVKYVAVHDTNPYAAQLAEAERVVKLYGPGSADYSQAMNDYTIVKYHYDAWEKEHGSSAEFGTVTVSDDGKIVTVTYAAVDSFSPFIVYAFVEADEPEYKELSATLHTEHTYEKGKCTVCGAADPDYVPESSSPQTGDNTPTGTTTPTGTAPTDTTTTDTAPTDTATTGVPKTGDNGNTALWLALLLFSGGALVPLTVYDRKRRKAVTGK